MTVPAVDEVLAHYREADERMRDLPFYNGRLSVEAVGFTEWEGRGLGVVIAPWLINLVVLPGADDDWSGLAQGEQTDWRFPAETVRLTANRLDAGGIQLTAPVFTTALDFPDQATARAVAAEIVPGLLAAPDRSRGETAPLSRRDFLRGKRSAR